MEQVGAEVGVVRPDNGPEVAVDSHLPKELLVCQGSENAAAPEDSRREIDDSAQSVGKSQFEAISVQDSRLGDRCARLRHTQFLYADES